MIEVVTDSTCDIPDNTAQAIGVSIIPAHVNIGQQTYRDGVDLDRKTFYEWLPSLPDLPTTSAPSPSAFIEIYERLLSKAEHVVSIHVASKLSSIYNVARLAAQEVAPGRISIVDSGQVSMGLGWPVMAAVEAVRRRADLDDVLDCVRDTLRRVRVYAILNTVHFLAKSGRVSPVELGLTTLLQIKPMVELREGVVSSLGRIRTWTKAVNALANRARSLGPVERLAVLHSNCVECANDLRSRIQDILPTDYNALTADVTTVIGTHVGPHGLGIAAVIN